MQVLKSGGLRHDLSGSPDLFFHILTSLTNLEERLNSLDRRLIKIENREEEKKQESYHIKKKRPGKK
jgi:hypothetical protein